MCLPWCCWPFVDVELEDPPKKKDKEEKRYIMVEDGSLFYPTPEPKTAPVYYTSYPQYYYVEPAPAPKPATPKPDKHVYWYGSSRQEVDVQNHAIYKAHAKPTPLVPYEPSAEEQFWVRELDGSWTLRTSKDVGDNCQPGYWQQGESGYHHFYRTA
ncbi:hypothetical protein MMC27_007006 [Xylographa pallens]|nr:hypothetical protein [Xylographa pallens]